MNVTATLTEIDKLVAMLTARYIADPKLAYQVVTGSCTWPPQYVGEVGDDDIDDLLERVADDIVDMEQAVGLFVPDAKPRLVKLRAAQAALTYHADDIRDRQRAFWEAYENRPHITPRRYA